MDTEIYTGFEDYIKILEDLGFNIVFKAPFVGKTVKNKQWEPQEDTYFILWKNPILVSFDTHGKFINGGFVWYNWKPNNKNCNSFIECGHWKEDVWVGYHDCRVEFCKKLKNLHENGTFISPWIDHNLCLINYMEEDPLHTNNRIGLLPEEVKSVIWKASSSTSVNQSLSP